MSMLDKIRGKFFNRKSFNVGFNNRSPLSYITSTGPSVPSMPDPGMKSFEPQDWYAAYDTSGAVKAETEAYKNLGQAIGETGYVAAGAFKKDGFKNNMGELAKHSVEDEIMPDSRKKKQTDKTTPASSSPDINIYNQIPGNNSGQNLLNTTTPTVSTTQGSGGTKEMKLQWCKDYPDSTLCD